MAAPPGPPRPELSEQRRRSFSVPPGTDRAATALGPAALRAVLAARVTQRRSAPTDRAADTGSPAAAAEDLRAVLGQRLDERREAAR
jgi:hypothetical protein